MAEAEKKMSKLPSWRTLLDFGLVLGGTAFATGTGFFLKVVIGRRLGADELGLFALCYAILTTVSILADFGIRYSMVNLGSRVLEENPARVRSLVAAGMLVKFVGGLSVALVGWLVAPYVAEFLFHKPEVIPFVQISAVGVFLWALWDGLEGALHIRQRFSTAAALRILLEGLRLIAFLGLFFYRDGILLTMDRYMWLYFVAPAASVVVGSVLVWRLFEPSVETVKETVQELVHFSRGIFLFRSAATVLLFLDSLMLTRYGMLSDVGKFEAAKGLAYAMLLVSESLGMVLLPKVNRIQSLDGIRNLLRRCGFYFCVLVVTAGVWLVVAANLLVLFGEQFTVPEVVTTFQIMVAVTLFTIPSTILGTVLMSLRRPDALGKIGTFQVILGCLLYPVTCVQGGIIGTALTGLVLQLVGSLAMGMVLASEIRGKTHHPAFADLHQAEQ